jgi:hypothetical protein
MERKSDTEIIRGWLQYNYTKNKSFFWAIRCFSRICLYDPDKAWDLILKILKEDDSQEIMNSLAAGPLENLLGKYGKELMDRVKKEAISNEKFNYLLGGVWQNTIDGEIWNEIEKIRKKVW